MHYRRRKGYSAFRLAGTQDSHEIKRLYSLAGEHTAARQQLKRWGFNYQRRCCLLTGIDKLFVHIPRVDELYPCVDFRDRMHAGVIFMHRVLFEVLDTIVRKAKHRRMLDERLAFLARRGFRVSGTTFRSQKSIFTDTGMTAADKSCVVFLLSHVLGGGGEDTEIWPEGVLLPLTTAVAHAQLVLLALRGRRSYTKRELQVIFDRGYVMMFGALETVRQIHHDICMREAIAKSEPAPKRFKRETRYVVKSTDRDNKSTDMSLDSDS